jgi:fibronectin-binding autotransporter adhesin
MVTRGNGMMFAGGGLGKLSNVCVSVGTPPRGMSNVCGGAALCGRVSGGGDDGGGGGGGGGADAGRNLSNAVVGTLSSFGAGGTNRHGATLGMGGPTGGNVDASTGTGNAFIWTAPGNAFAMFGGAL